MNRALLFLVLMGCGGTTSGPQLGETCTRSSICVGDSTNNTLVCDTGTCSGANTLRMCGAGKLVEDVPCNNCRRPPAGATCDR